VMLSTVHTQSKMPTKKGDISPDAFRDGILCYKETALDMMLRLCATAFQ